MLMSLYVRGCYAAFFKADETEVSTIISEPLLIPMAIDEMFHRSPDFVDFYRASDKEVGWLYKLLAPTRAAVPDIELAAGSRTVSPARMLRELVDSACRKCRRWLGPKSIVAGSIAIAVVAVAIHVFRKYGTRSLYDPERETGLLMTIQRALLDKTVVKYDTTLYPLDGFQEPNDRRTDNGHALSGALRDSARELVEHHLLAKGLVKHEINPSTYASPNTMHHMHVAPGDLGREHQVDPVPPGSVIVAFDVDHFLPDVSVLLEHMNPTVLYTFNPINVSGNDGDCHFTIVDNTVSYAVGGGGLWQHKVHDWCRAGEYVESAIRPAGGLCGLWQGFLSVFGIVKVGVHKIHHARPWRNAKDRALVWTIPCYTYWRMDFVPSIIRGVRSIGRVDFKDKLAGGWNRIEFVDSDGNMQVSLGREGEQLSTKIARKDLDVILYQASSQAVATTLMSLGYREEKNASAMRHITQYFVATRSTGPPGMAGLQGEAGLSALASVRSQQLSTNVKGFWPVSCIGDISEAKISARAFAAPIIADTALAPILNDSGVMAETIVRRVRLVVNTQEPTGAKGERYKKFIREFVEFVVPNAHELDPMTTDEVLDALDKPRQKALVEGVLDSLSGQPSSDIRSFIKNEATNKTPRLISGFKDIRFVAHVSKFAIKVTSDILKPNCPWYFSASTPTAIAEGVASYFKVNHGQVCETDFSNMDGTISPWLSYNVLGAVMKRAFKIEHHSEIQRIVNSLVTACARSKRFGFSYDAGPGVKSGSPTTTLGNTLFNAAMEYVAIRHTYPNLQPELVFRGLGPKAGDDGLTTSSVGPFMALVCKDFGLTLKTVEYDPEHGLCFLGRVFTCLNCCTHSIQDPLRTIEKLHMTFRHADVPIADAAYDRCDSYLVTDGMTPLISEYCQMVQRLYNADINHSRRLARKDIQRDALYWARIPTDSWPQVEDKYDDTLVLMAKRIGCDAEALRFLIVAYKTASSVWDLPYIHTRDGGKRRKFHVEDDGSVDMSVALSYSSIIKQRDELLSHTRTATAPGSVSSDSGQGSTTGSLPSNERQGSEGCSSPGPGRTGPPRGKGSSHFTSRPEQARIPGGSNGNRGGGARAGKGRSGRGASRSNKGSRGGAGTIGCPVDRQSVSTASRGRRGRAN